ncbi:hypothetical protein SLEP1_g58950 [Rubroshorea leprosula]|uniref:Uncharacterized protein n=1 Tax=Rubroshorea leprosula TaxID=152421 RepID=A0AAV5MVG4_9ROSI|nr:hypothetical protein SLEP1_g58950 [Rubroshorea leprosula]
MQHRCKETGNWYRNIFLRKKFEASLRRKFSRRIGGCGGRQWTSCPPTMIIQRIRGIWVSSVMIFTAQAKKDKTCCQKKGLDKKKRSLNGGKMVEKRENYSRETKEGEGMEGYSF